MKRAKHTLVVSIGSTDPTGVAGVGRDLIVYERLGASGAMAVGAVTAQNQRHVAEVYPLPPRVLRDQIDAIIQERKPAAIRIGLLPDAQLVAVVARFLRRLRPRVPVVLDPVIVSSSGHRFLGAAELGALEGLLPLVTVVTPNALEAGELTGTRVGTTADAEKAAKRLQARGCAVLVTGGHIRGQDVVDVLADKQGIVRLRARRIPARMRGTGCTLAAAIAAFLARGATLRSAVVRARRFVREELEAHRGTRAKGRA